MTRDRKSLLAEPFRDSEQGACDTTSWCPGCGGDGWYVGHEDECYETGDCNCSGVQIECECGALRG